MSRSLIVAVGGTGQLVLHYYAQLFQIKAVPDPFHAVVVDSDELLPSLQRLRDFWNVARVAHAQPDLVPRIDYFPVARELGGTVQEALVGRDLPALPDIHPAEAIFDSTSLTQSVREGLYARPALSAVLQTEWSRFPLETLSGFKTLLVVGSLIGGTGGGLIAPLLSELARRIRAAAAIAQPEIRAVFFGEYFELRGDSPVPDASLRFPSNKLMVAYCLKALAPPELKHFAFIEPATRRARVVSDERNPINLSWPPQNDAIWMGVSALEALRINSAWPSDEEFQRKEKTALPLCNLETCVTILNDRLALARTFDKKTVFKRLIHEPWLTTFYGPNLPAMLARATAAAKQKPALNISGPQSLASLVQEQYAAKWNDVASVFPLTPEKKVSPAVLRQTGWSDLNVNVPGFNASQQALTASTAAHVLYSSLRGNEENRDPVSTVSFTGNQNRISNLLQEQTPWEAYTVFGESIPHLLHWDWAYLWIMSRQSLKPRAWETRIEAWRRLLCMLLLNELQLEAVPIEQPLLGYTKPVNLREIVLARWPGHFDDRPIALLSPTVIIRPLPDPNRLNISASNLVAELPKHYDPLPGALDRRSELAQMVELAKGRIAALAERLVQDGGSEFARRLLDVLRSNLRITQSGSAAKTYEALQLPYAIPLLVRADASAWTQMKLTELTLDVSSGGRRPLFVPKCRFPGCRRILTQAELDPPVEVTGPQIQLRCRSCNQETTYDLEDFGIWNQGLATYVWQELEIFEGLATVPLPPSPEIQDDQIWFRWNSADTGDPIRVHLRLHFPERQPQRVRPSDVKYRSLLIAGEFSQAKSIPIRPEWLFALDQNSVPEPEFERDVIVYRNVRFKGLKYPVVLGRYPKAACTVVPDFQVGMYPKPMYPDWKRYRFFCSGPDAGHYRACMVGDMSQPEVGPWKPAEAMETLDGMPKALSLEAPSRTGTATTGATWVLPKAPTNVTIHAVHAGIDFGTTNTVVYVQVPVTEVMDRGPETRPVIIERKDLIAAAHVIAGKGEARAAFLPLQHSATQDATDVTLIPSALWVADGQENSPIRWRSTPPPGPYYAKYRFKWGGDSKKYRERYLDELLFLILPAALKKLFREEAAKANWRIGFAFPLAFSSSQRQEYGFLYDSLRQSLDQYTSSTVEVKNINESYACVRALGQFQEGSILLVADLGGGSLDVALFEIKASPEGYGRPSFFQVGSARIGGESFVRTIANKMGANESSRDEKYSVFRDAIMAGRVAKEFPSGDFDTVANRFLTIVQELLRVMVASFRQQFPGKPVQLVLAGNGWRIAEFTANSLLAPSVARSELARALQEFEITGFTMYKEELSIPPKHLVAIGALENAGPKGQIEIPGAVNEVKMPAGRNIRLKNTGGEIKWSDLVGPSGANLPLGTGPAHVEIARQSGPHAAPQWQQRLQFALPNLDSNPRDEDISNSLGFASTRIETGPLQIILEKRAEDLS